MGCHRSADDPQTLVLLIEARLARLDPRFAGSSWENKVAQLIAPGLTTIDNPQAETRPALASSVEQEDPVTYLAALRPDARFPDGAPVTADDVAYTFESVQAPELGSRFSQTWAEILARVEVVDPSHVRFHLRAPRAPFLTDLTFGIVEASVARPLDEAVRAAARAHQRAPAFDPLHEVVGAGPYRIAARTGERLDLEANPHASTPPRTPRLSIRTVPDENARFLALLGGSGDLIQNGVVPLVAETFESNARVRVDYQPSAMTTYLGFNTGHGATADPRVRRALALAIDRAGIVQAKLRGHASLARSFLPPSNAYLPGDLPTVPFDPEAARRLLDEAGYRDPDGDGPLPRLTLTFKTSNQRFRVSLAHVLAQSLATVGVAVEVRPYEWGTFLDDVKKGNFDLFSLQATDLVEPDMLRAFFHSARIPRASVQWNGNNRVRYQDAEVDAWLDEGTRTSDRARRFALYRLVQLRLARDLPVLPLWHEDNVILARQALQGFQPRPQASLGGLLGAFKRPVR